MTDELIQLAKLISLGMALMLPLANPLTSMTLLLSLGQQIPYKERQRQVTQAAFYVVGIMLVTYYAGALLMHTALGTWHEELKLVRSESHPVLGILAAAQGCLLLCSYVPPHRSDVQG